MRFRETLVLYSGKDWNEKARLFAAVGSDWSVTQLEIALARIFLARIEIDRFRFRVYEDKYSE